MENEIKNEKGIALGVSIIAVLVILMILPFIYGFEFGSVTKGPASILAGIYLQFWGILFLLSYFYPHKTFFFRGLIWVCENVSHPKSRKMAFFGFALTFGLGTSGLIQGLGLFSTKAATPLDSMVKKIDCKYVPALILDYSVNESSEPLNNILLSTSFENLDISAPNKVLPFIISGKENWKVHTLCSRSGKYCLNIIPEGNGSSEFFSLLQSIFGKDHNYAILNSQFSNIYKPFDISKFDFVELEFWRYSTSNPDRRRDFNCGSSLDIYYRLDDSTWEHKMSFCGEHKYESSGWRNSKLEFNTRGHSTIEFKFVYHLVVQKRDPDVFYLIDDLQVKGFVNK